MRNGLTKFIPYLFPLFLSVYYFCHQLPILDLTLDEDEIFSWMGMTDSWLHFFNSILNDSQQFLYFFIAKVFQNFWGADDFWLRVPSLAFGSLTIGSIFCLYKKVFSGVVACLICGLLFYNSTFTYISTYNRPYALLSLLIVLNFISVWELLDNPPNRKKSENFFFITVLLMSYTHYLGMIYTVAILAGLALMRVKFKISKRKLGFILVFLSLYSIQFAYQYSHSVEFIKWTKEDGGVFHYLGFRYLFNNPHKSAQATATIAGFMIFISFLIRGKIKVDQRRDKFVLFNAIVFVIGLFLFAFASIGSVSLFVDKYLMFFYFILLTLVAYGFQKIIDFKDGNAIVVLILLFVSFEPSINEKLYDLRIDIRGFFHGLKNESFANKKVLCFYEGRYVGLLGPYSKMYLKRDICDKHVARNRSSGLLFRGEYDYVIRVLNADGEYLKKKNFLLANLKVVHKAENIVVYQLK